jgi:DNA-binding CsgD family transcriptional regulator
VSRTSLDKSSKSEGERGHTTPPGAPVPWRVRALIEDLVAEAARIPERARGAARDAAGRDVVLDVEFGGFRYVLARAPLAIHRPPAVLSSRELEIARMIAAGHTNKTVARVLDISSWTVSTHLRRIFAKLDVGSRAAMVARLLEDGMLGERLDGTEGPFSRRR